MPEEEVYKDLIFTDDIMLGKLEHIEERYANFLEQKIIDLRKQNKELFNKTIEFFEQHLPSMYIEEYKKTVADLVEQPVLD